MKSPSKIQRLLGVFVSVAVAAACANGPEVENARVDAPVETSAQVESANDEPECLRQFNELGEALRETFQAIESAESDHEKARRAFVESDNRDEAERGLAALNNQSFRLAGLYAALAGDVSTAKTSEFAEIADRFTSAAMEMSVAYAEAATSSSPGRIVAAQPVMEAAARALGAACLG